MAVDDKKRDNEKEVLDAIASMPDEDRVIGEKLHEVIMASAPELVPRTWYGMPAYSKAGRVVLFFRSKKKFGERFMTLGFNDVATLDDGDMWPIYYAIKDLTDVEEAEVARLVQKAVK